MSKLLSPIELANSAISSNPLFLLNRLEEEADTITLEELFDLRDDIEALGADANVISFVSLPTQNLLNGTTGEELRYFSDFLTTYYSVVVSKYLDLVKRRIEELRKGQEPQPVTPETSWGGYYVFPKTRGD